MSDPLLDHDAIVALCHEHGVQRLSAFGSAVRNDFDPDHSDIDLLVEYLPGVDSLESYFGLKADLEELFGRPVDLVMARALRNPFLIQAIQHDLTELYAA